MSKFESPEFLIEKYKKAYFQNPSSKFFAPLAEAHRKAGNYDEAIDLLKRGIKDHPHYASAYVCLAQCYLDLNQLNIAFSLLSPLVSDHSENYKLMSLFAEVAEKLGFSDRALDTYKTLLFLHPKDQGVIAKVRGLEASLSKPAVSEDTNTTLFNLSSIEDTNWHEVSLSSIEDIEASTRETDLPKEVVKEEAKIEVKIDFDDDKYEEEPISFETQPVITHTLVDLYLNQGHREKALEILEKFLEANPRDQRSLEKKKQILELSRVVEVEQVASENPPAKSIMEIYDQKIGDVESLKTIARKEKLELFLLKLREHASQKGQAHVK
jgi:tetratricopeptide (TPR) repeat protein